MRGGAMVTQEMVLAAEVWRLKFEAMRKVAHYWQEQARRQRERADLAEAMARPARSTAQYTADGGGA